MAVGAKIQLIISGQWSTFQVEKNWHGKELFVDNSALTSIFQRSDYAVLRSTDESVEIFQKKSTSKSPPYIVPPRIAG